jgi:hypothetical protein
MENCGNIERMTTSSQETKKSSTVRHTRAIQRDRTKRPVVGPPDEQVAARLMEIVHPATLSQLEHYRQLGLRARILSLPVMVGLVLSMIWRQVNGVCELTRLIRTEVLLWAPPLRVTQQAISERLCSLPAELFVRVLEALMPVLQARWAARQRPLPAEIAWAQQHYSRVLIVDGSTLDALIRKLGLLRDWPNNPLAGRMTAVLDLCSRLPFKIWYAENPQAHDQTFWPRILSALPQGALLIFDLGYTNFKCFLHLSTQAQVTFITRAKSNLDYSVEKVLQRGAAVHDTLVWIGSGPDRQRVRLIEVLYRGTWYRYLTNELDLTRLPTAYVVALYWQRWRIEDAYAIVKRLLGLAYFHCAAPNAVQMQLWATWMLYGVLVDLTDAVAEALHRPFAAISMEMVYRSLYYFTQAYHRGETTDVAAYLAANAKLLGIIKRTRKNHRKSPLAELSHLTNSGDP